METRKTAPVELNDEELNQVSGGVTNGANAVDPNDKDHASAFEGMDIVVGAFTEA